MSGLSRNGWRWTWSALAVTVGAAMLQGGPAQTIASQGTASQTPASNTEPSPTQASHAAGAPQVGTRDEAAPPPPPALPALPALPAPPAPRPATLYLRDGTTLDGDTTLGPDGVYVVSSRPGAEVRVGKEHVLRVEYRESFTLEYSRRRKELGPTDAQGRVELARYCLASRRPDLARELLEEAMRLSPDDGVTADLLRAATSQAELAARADEAGLRTPASDRTGTRATAHRGTTRPALPVGSAGGGTVGSAAGGTGTLLDPEQINFVKQAEFRRGESGVNFRFDNDVERKYSAATGVSISALRQLTPGERFWTISRDPIVGAELGKDVRVLRDPAAVRVFRSAVQRVVLSGCATSGCHGTAPAGAGADLGPVLDSAATLGAAPSTRPSYLPVDAATSALWLLSPAETEAATYTNFFQLATGQGWVKLPSGRTVLRPIVNRQSPEASLLLQFSLPAELAVTPHPRVPGFGGQKADPTLVAVRPIFRAKDDARYLAILDWIENTLSPVEPDYSLFPTTPGGKADAEPSEAQPGQSGAAASEHGGVRGPVR